MRRGRSKNWTDEVESDPGIALLELLAFVGDLLSYYQEEIAAEARLKTRRRSAFALCVLIALVSWRRRGVD